MNHRHASALMLASVCALAACDDDAPANAVDSGASADLGTPATDGPASDSGTPATDAGTPGVDVGTPTTDLGSPTTDVGSASGAGTCASPIRFNTEGTLMGTDLVYRGNTAGLTDALHPYEGCVERDSVEAVLSYRVPAGTGALMFTTEGSAFDTVLYVRNACSQAAGGTDTACNNDSYDRSPQSTVYVTNALEGQTIYLVVDGSSAEGSTPSGSFVLTARRVPFGGMGAPCRAVTEPATPRCDGALRCSEGGAADGTPLCVPAAATNAACDPRGFTNVCLEGVTCVTQPDPPEGMPAMSFCSLPGTRRGAPCRTAEPRCDGALACSSADPGTCVPVLTIGIACDPTGEGNRCAPGLTCGALGDGGMPICHSS
jgi:hypothetical protein